MKGHKKIERKKAFFGKRVVGTLIKRKKIGPFTTYAAENGDFLAVLPAGKRVLPWLVPQNWQNQWRQYFVSGSRFPFYVQTLPVEGKSLKLFFKPINVAGRTFRDGDIPNHSITKEARNLELLRNSNVSAELPFAIFIGKNGEKFLITSFVEGDNIFSVRERKKLREKVGKKFSRINDFQVLIDAKNKPVIVDTELWKRKKKKG